MKAIANDPRRLSRAHESGGRSARRRICAVLAVARLGREVPVRTPEEAKTL
jgi:hypothetical protein